MSTVPNRGCFDDSLGIWMWAAPHAALALAESKPLAESERGIEPRPALFLDRDGVIIEDPGYLCRAQDLQIIAGAAHLIALANRRSIPVVEITNQAGIGRGYYGWNEFAAVEEALTHLLAHENAAVDAVLACPYSRKGIAPWNHPEHPARKPRPGMLFAAQRLLHLDLRRSWIVGDRLSDLQAGYHAGLRGGLHVLTGVGRDERPAVTEWCPEDFELRLGGSIRDAEALLET